MKKILLIIIFFLLILSVGIFNQVSASNFSIEGTLWRVQISGIHITPYSPYIEPFGIIALLGFTDDRMFGCIIPEEGDTCTPDVEFPSSSNSYYIDSPMLSLAYLGGCSTTESVQVSCVSYIFLMQPIVYCLPAQF